MSSQELSFELYKWMSGLQLIGSTHRYKSSGNFQLDSKTIDSLISGFALSNLVIIIANQKGIPINQTLLSTIKSSNTTAARTYNWNILQQSFMKLGISLPKQMQKDIAAGNFATLVQFLMRVKTEITPKVTYQVIQKLEKQNLANREKEFDIKNIRALENAEDAQSVLQLVVFLINKNFNLTPKQVVSTLSQNGKYFAHMVVKGIKGSHLQVIQLYAQIYQHIPKILYLSQKDPQKNAEFMLELLKPALISRDQDVTKVGCMCFEAFIEESLKYNSKNLVYQILCKDSMGFDFIYMGIKRHPSLINQIFSFMYPLIRDACRNFFQTQFYAAVNNQQQYLRSIITLLPAILVHPQAKKILLQSKTTQIWIQNCEGMLDKHPGISVKRQKQQISEQAKLLYLELLCELWKAYEGQFQSQENQNLLMRVIEQLKKNTRKDTYILKSAALYRLFDFLQYLANQKNKFASLIYKKIIFLFIQNHEDDQIRQIILQNFSLVLRKFPTIPLQFLLDPFLKQLTSKQGTSYILNLYDIQFVLDVCKHPKMQASFALSFLDFFSKLYIKSIIFSKLIFRIIQIVTDRFCENEAIIEYCLKNTQQMLNLYGVLVLGKKKQAKDQVVINNQKKSMIIQLIKHYIALQHLQMNSGIKQVVLKLYISWRQQRNYRDKGLQSIIQLFGDVDEVIMSHRVIELQRQRQRQKYSASVVQSHRTQELTPLTNQSIIPRNKLHQLKKYADSQVTLLKPDQFNKGQEFFKQHGFGYKKKGVLSKQQRMNILLSRQDLKPQPKALEDIQKIKTRVKEDEARKKIRLQIEQKRNRDKYKGSINQQQLFQRNLSLGYTKLPEYTDDRILFDFDSVKTKHLKQDPHFINLDEEEEREKLSVDHILSKHQKYTKIIFNKYAYASVADRKTTMISQRSSISLSFTEIIRMLKDKGLNRIPKLIINELMAKINHSLRKQRNILGGIFEQDFGQFLVELTHVLNTLQKNKVDLPLGGHMQKTIRALLQGQSISKQFNDPKVIEYKKKVSPFIQQQPEIPIPEGYKKIKQKDMILTYSITLDGTGVEDSFLDCFDIVDYIFEKATGMHIISPSTQIVTRHSITIIPRIPKLKRLLPQSTQKAMKSIQSEYGDTNIQGQNQKDKFKNHDSKSIKAKNIAPKKSLSHKNLKLSPQNKTIDPATLQEKKRKEKLRQQHAQKLKDQLMKLRQEKMQKQQEQKKKELQQQQKKKKKQQNRKKYLQDNKKRIEQKNQKQQTVKAEKMKKQQVQKQEQKQKLKKKQAELLQKQRKRIQEKIQKRKQVQKQKEAKLQSPSKESNDKLKNKVFEQLSLSKQQRDKQAELKKSIQSGGLKHIIDRYQRQINQLFQTYQFWQTQTIDLNTLAHILRDFNLTPGYIAPKHVAQVYKTVSKGQLLQLKGFTECLVRLSYKSAKIIQTVLTKRETQKNASLEKLETQGSYDPQTFVQFCQKMQMQQANYKLVLKQTKQKDRKF